MKEDGVANQYISVFTRRVRKVKIHHVYADRGIFYAYCGNTAVDLDPLLVSRARLTVIEPTLFEWDVFEMVAPIQSPAKCEVRSVIRSLNSTSGLKFLTRYAQEGDEFLDSIVTGDKTWGFHHTPEVRWRWWVARRGRDVLQRADGRLLWLGDTEAGSKT
jgi:hypothetical protein